MPQAMKVLLCDYYRIAGVTIRVKSNSEQAMQRIRGVFPRYLSASPCSRPITYLVESSEDKSPLQNASYALRGGRGKLYCETVGVVHLIPCLERLVLFRVLEKSKHLFQIHAGAVEREGKALLLPALAGSGKTLLTLGLVNKGFKFLSDDVALVDPDSAFLRPLPMSPVVKGYAFSFLSALDLSVGADIYRNPLNGESLYYFDLTDISPDPVGVPSPVRFVFFPCHDSAVGSLLRPVSRAEAAARMIQNSLNFEPSANRFIDLATRLVGKAECFDLRFKHIGEGLNMIEEAASHRERSR